MTDVELYQSAMVLAASSDKEYAQLCLSKATIAAALNVGEYVSGLFFLLTYIRGLEAPRKLVLVKNSGY